MTELEIKKLLVRHFLEKYKNCVVGSEFSFQFGERRADLALLNADYLSAFEIKGARDTVSRLRYQIESYKKFFDFCFVVCEPSNLTEVRTTIPRDVGILIAEKNGITHVRQSKQFKRHDKKVLSSALSVPKLMTLAKGNHLRSKHELCEFVSKNNTVESLRILSRHEFNDRYGVASKLLKQETTQYLTSDDIYTITKKAPSLLKRRIV
jgi:ribosomal protein L17